MSKLKPILAGLTALATVAATYGLGLNRFLDITVGMQPSPVELTVKARDLDVACPGGALRIGGSNGLKVGKVDRYASANVDVAQNLESGQQLKVKLIGQDESQPLSLAQVGRIANSQGLSLIAADPSGEAKQSSFLLSGIQTQVLSTSAVSGLASAGCQVAASEQWLIGAETLTGRESILVLQNTTNVDASADLRIFSEGGELESAALSSVVVSANDFTVIPLATLAPKAKTLALQVTSTGGAITAWVQQKTTRGLATGGIDYIVSQSAASTQLSLPGLFIRGSKKAAQLIASNDDYRDLIPSLHVFVPGNTDAKFTAQVISSTTGAFGTVIEQTVAASQIARFEIPDLADGDYAVLIDSDQPIQATVSFSRVAAKAPDFAYLIPAPDLTQKRSLVAPAGYLSRLSLVNPNDQAAKVSIYGPNEQTVVIDKFSAAQILVKSGSLITIESDLPVAASLVIDADSAVSVVNLVDYKNEPTRVSVVVR